MLTVYKYNIRMVTITCVNTIQPVQGLLRIGTAKDALVLLSIKKLVYHCKLYCMVHLLL